MFSSALHLKLSTKAKILMGIPLSVQCFSVLFLTSMLEEAEQETMRVQRSREVTMEALTFATNVYDAEYVLYRNMEELRVSQSHNRNLCEKYDQMRADIPKYLRSLKGLVVDSPEQKEIVDPFILQAARLLRIMDHLNANLKKDHLMNVFTLGAIMASGGGPLEEMSKGLRKLTALTYEQSKLEISAKGRRQRAQELLIISVVVNIVIVLALFVIFNRGTLSRLKVVVENTKRFASKKPLHAVLTGGDEIAQLDRAFHEMSDAVEAANRREQELMETKRQLMAMVSHDLRAPLTSLQMTLNLLNKNVYGDLTEKAQERIESSEENVRRLIRMINDLLDLEKLEAGKMDLHVNEVPLPVIVERSIDSVSEWAKKKEIVFDYDATELEVKVDGDRLIQVLVNLFSNAIKYSPDKSTVKIRSALKENFVEVRVIDSGPGVPEQYRKQIFERYRQIEDSEEHKSKGGTGLGLAICKIIVEQHGGSVGVEPAVEGGSCFWITVPAVLWQSDGEETLTADVLIDSPSAAGS